MKISMLLIPIIIGSLLLILLIFIGLNLGAIFPLQNTNDTLGTYNYSVTICPTPIINSSIMGDLHNNSTDIQPINGDLVFNNINWSRYPNIYRIKVHDNEISEPTYVINHPFLYFTVDVDVKDPENTRELFREMAGVVIEIRQKVGPNSSISVWGLVDGFDRYHVGILPYENRVYAIDHYHPQAYKNDIYLIPGDDIYDYHSYTIVNNSVIEP